MHDEDRLGWIKLFSLLSIVTAVGSVLFAGYYIFAVLELSPWVGLALSGTAFFSGCAAVVLDLKFDLQDSLAAVAGIFISLLTLGLFVWIVFF